MYSSKFTKDINKIHWKKYGKKSDRRKFKNIDIEYVDIKCSKRGVKR